MSPCPNLVWAFLSTRAFWEKSGKIVMLEHLLVENMSLFYRTDALNNQLHVLWGQRYGQSSTHLLPCWGSHDTGRYIKGSMQQIGSCYHPGHCWGITHGVSFDCGIRGFELPGRQGKASNSRCVPKDLHFCHQWYVPTGKMCQVECFPLIWKKT